MCPLGGVIEACPSLSVGNLTGCMFLHPDGEIDFHGVHEQVGCSFVIMKCLFCKDF